VAAGTGIYKTAVTFADGFSGTLLWDTGEATPRYAAEEVNPEELGANALDPALDLADAIGGGTLREALRAMAAALAGNLAEEENVDGTAATTTIRDFLDSDTVRITAVSTPTSRTVTVEG
jgi:hypothetical protein